MRCEFAKMEDDDDMGNRPMPSDMTCFFISSRNLSMWMHQNKAEYTGDYVEGVLLDNFMLICKRGYAAVYEHYVNVWTSNYRVEFQPGKAQDVWSNWYKFEEAEQALRKESEENYRGSDCA